MARENNPSIGAQLKKEMVNYIGPIFEELKTEIKGVREELKTEIKGVREELKTEIKGVREELKTEIKGVRTEIRLVESRLTDKINWQGTIMDQMNKKIDLALELAGTAQSNNMTVKEHTIRIESLETDVKILKDVRSP